MGWKSQFRATQATERRQQRDAQKRFRELERQAKEQAKLSAIEQARLEVESFESGLEVLLSIHKEQGDVWNWPELATALPPHTPSKFARHALKAKQALDIQALDEAHAQDEREYQEALQSYATEMIYKGRQHRGTSHDRAARCQPARAGQTTIPESAFSADAHPLALC